MPDWTRWLAAEQAGTLNEKQAAMLDRARARGEAPGERRRPTPETATEPARALPVVPTPPSFLERLAPTIDPMSGMPISGSSAEAESFRQGMGEAAGPVAAGAIGTALPLIGAGVGSMGGPGGALGGEMIGSIAGREINKALGLEEPGYKGDLAAALLAPGLRSAGTLIKGIAKRIPGVGVGMQELGTSQARSMAPALTPRTSASTIYDRVAEMNPSVKLDHVSKVAEEMLEAQMKLAPQQRSAPIVNAAEGWLGMATNPEGIDFQSAWLAQKQLRQHISGVGGLDEGARKLLDGAIMRDFEAIPGPVSQVLKEANATYRKERALETLTGYIEGNITEAVQGQGTPRINAGAILKRFDKALRDDDLFAGAFSAQEKTDISKTLKIIADYPVAGAVAGATYGAGLGLGSGSIGFALGMDPQSAAGITAVMTVLPIVLSTPPGRALVRGLATSGKLWTPPGSEILRTFARGAGRSGAQQALQDTEGAEP